MARKASATTPNWRILGGDQGWDRHLEPLNIALGDFIIHYGERAQANYDGFEKGFSLYPTESLFANVGLEKGHQYTYEVKKYLFATSDIDFPTKDWVVKGQYVWIGYVAVATDGTTAKLGRRDILITWRGTQSATDWFERFDDSLTSASDIFGSDDPPQVHKGFYTVYVSPKQKSNAGSARCQALEAVKELVDCYQNKEEISITVTGHSLGAGLATLNAADIVANGYNRPKNSATTYMVTAFLFGSPKVGDEGFQSTCDNLSNLHLLRIENKYDVVPRLPSNKSYYKVGKEKIIDTTGSPDLKPHVSFLPELHNLENYLHGVARAKGGVKFDSVERDFTLVNKELDLLKDEFNVPPKWWDPAKNERMNQQDDGIWKLYVPDPTNA